MSAARSTAALLAAAVALAGFSACGEDTGSGAGTTSAPSNGSSADPAGKTKTTPKTDGGGY